LLDSLTLRVKDKEIQDHYNMMRVAEFNKYCYPILILATLYLIVKIFTFAKGDDPPVRVIFAFINFAHPILWIVLRKWRPRHAMIMPYIYLLTHCILTNLSFRDWLPEVMIEPDKSNDDGKVVIMLILTHTVNYNPFTVSLLVPTTIIAIAFTFQLLAQVNMYSDPYTGKPLETYADKVNFVSNKVFSVCCMLFAITVHNYVI
jgi:hypothetical protein